MSFNESFITVSPTGSTPLRTITGSPGRHIEVMASTDPNLGIIFPNQVNITGSIPLSFTGSVTQATIPWIETGSVYQAGSWTVSATEGTSPWTITGSVSVQNVVSITGSLTSGSFVNAFITNPVTGGANPVAITGSSVGPVANITGSVYQIGTWNVNDIQSTNPWVISGSDRIYGSGSATYPGINEANVLTGSPGGTEGGLVVRNIPSGTQAVSASQTTNPWIITGSVNITSLPLLVEQYSTVNTNSNIYAGSIGPVDVNQGSGIKALRTQLVANQEGISGSLATITYRQTGQVVALDVGVIGSQNVTLIQDPVSQHGLLVAMYSGSLTTSPDAPLWTTGSTQILTLSTNPFFPYPAPPNSTNVGVGFNPLTEVLNTQPVGSSFNPFNQDSSNNMIVTGTSTNGAVLITGSGIGVTGTFSATPPQFQAVTGSSIGVSVIVQPSGSLIFPVSGSSIGLPIVITGSLTSGSFVNAFVTNQVPVLQGIGGAGGPITWIVGGTVGLTGSNITAVTGSSSGLPVTITGSLTSGSFVNAFITNQTNPVAITGSTVGPIANITGSFYQIGNPYVITGSLTSGSFVNSFITNQITTVSSTQGTSPWIIGGNIGITGSAGQPYQNIINPVSGSSIGLPVTVTGSMIGTFGITGSAGQPFQNIIRPTSGSSVGPPVTITGSIIGQIGFSGSSVPISVTGSSSNAWPVFVTGSTMPIVSSSFSNAVTISGPTILLAAPGVGLRYYITSLGASNVSSIQSTGSFYCNSGSNNLAFCMTFLPSGSSLNRNYNFPIKGPANAPISGSVSAGSQVMDVEAFIAS
jgi:hypothetical protein